MLDVTCESSRPGSPQERVSPILGAGLHPRQRKRQPTTNPSWNLAPALWSMRFAVHVRAGRETTEPAANVTGNAPDARCSNRHLRRLPDWILPATGDPSASSCHSNQMSSCSATQKSIDLLTVWKSFTALY